MLGTVRSTAQRRVVTSLWALSEALDAMPSIGRSLTVEEEPAEPGQDHADDLVIDVGGFIVHRHGGWATRWTLLPYFIADLDQRWATNPTVASLEPPPRLRAVN